MVVFTCQKCNSTLKKNAVEKHNSCRPFFLTCIDCLKDFRGAEYNEHKSCITEAQKYGGSNTVLKPQGVKQANWVEITKKILEELSHDAKYKKICLWLKDASNIPRNRSKFHNFIKSTSPRSYNSKEVDEIFNYLKDAKSNKNEDSSEIKTTSSKNDESILEQDESISNNEKNIKKKKKKTKDLEGSNHEVNENENEIENNNSQADVSRNSEIANESRTDEINKQIKEKESKKRLLHETELPTADENYDNSKKRKKDRKEKKKKISLDGNQDYQNKENQENCEIKEESQQEESFKDHNCSEKEVANGMEMLSKKERKKLKKQKKYMAEIAEVENFQPQKDSDDLMKEEKVKKKKKKNIETEEVAASQQYSPKRKLEENNVEEIIDKKMKLNETLHEEEISKDPGKKFKWGNVIKQVLENTPSNELSLKKLRKKVFNEYKVQKGDDVPYEKLLGIFNKKINSTVGVKIIKDRAQLSV